MPIDPRLDELVSHRIGIERLSTSVIRQILPALEDAHRDITDIIRNRIFDAGTVTRSEVRRLEAALRNIRTAQVEAYRTITKRLMAELRGLAVHERDWANNYYREFFGLKAGLETPSANMIAAAALERPMSGRPLKAWADKMQAEHIAEVERQIRLGVLEGESIDQMVKRLRGTPPFGVGGVFPRHGQSAEILTRTAVNHISNSAHLAFLRGSKGAFSHVQWVSVLDNRTCADGNTRIKTAVGWRRIMDIRRGDQVIAGTGCLRSVRGSFTRGVSRLARVTLSNGQVILCTPDHLFLRGDQRWVEAQDLAPGAELASKQEVSGNALFNRQPFDEVFGLRGADHGFAQA